MKKTELYKNENEYIAGQLSLAKEAPIFSEGINCHAIRQSTYASVIVDCANYYRALHEAIAKAQKSLFIVGWDIDSRIELLRGSEAARSLLPTRFFDLIKWKAEQKPDFQIYLNRWDYSLYMAAEREGLSKMRWWFRAPANVHYCLDNAHPIGACHHQKIVVIDDELAFVGGMDIALGRWDYRQHHPENSKRVDPGGTYEPHTSHNFGPHHDVMFMVAGPVVASLATLVRKRWKKVQEQDMLPAQGLPDLHSKPQTWPPHIEPDFEGATIAIARTLPPVRSTAPVREIEQLYIDEIKSAKRFIYMENQYFTSLAIAEALNRQLLTTPGLRALLVSCHKPQGFFERKGMWHGRLLFHDRLMEGGVADKIVMANPISRENGKVADIRVHSKLMIVDDQFLHIGSANINNRSMRLDSECDLSLQAHSEAQRQKIASVRNDLIREHTGFDIDKIEQWINGSTSPKKFITFKSESRQHLQKIDDEQYRKESFASLVTRLADPEAPLFRRKL